MKKVFGLVAALVVGAAITVQAAPLENNNIKSNVVVVSNSTESVDGAQQVHRRVVVRHKRRVIHHRHRHPRPRRTVVVVHH